MDSLKLRRYVGTYYHRAKLAAIGIFAVQKLMLAKWPLRGELQIIFTTTECSESIFPI